MTQLTLTDIEDDVVRKLDERAARNGRTIEDEHKHILRRTLFWDALDPADSETMSWDDRAARLRKLTTGRQHTPSELLIREDRDNR